ncbi:hypothetical protein [Streptomyces sp. NPDC048611]|uniref:hypothetical protein n=1 Tax=Streptomyces sp. NPDC048611 TaxID=3155635 RepID=UPI00343A3C1E
MRLHRLHAAATAVVMWPLETLDRAVTAWRRWRDRGWHRELARHSAHDVAAGEDPVAVVLQILDEADRRLAPLYDTPHITHPEPHPTA